MQHNRRKYIHHGAHLPRCKYDAGVFLSCHITPQTKTLADLERLKESRESQMEENTRIVDAKKDEFIKRIRLIDQEDAEARARLDVVTAPLESFLLIDTEIRVLCLVNAMMLAESDADRWIWCCCCCRKGTLKISALSGKSSKRCVDRVLLA
jgi:hypothetical protein